MRGAAMELEDSLSLRAGVGQNSTRRLISVSVFQPTQLLLDQRRRPECAVSDLGDFLGLSPLPLELFDLCALIHRHFERESSLRPESPQRQLAPGDLADEMVGATDSVDLTRRVLGAAAAAARQVQVRQALQQHLDRFDP